MDRIHHPTAIASPPSVDAHATPGYPGNETIFTPWVAHQLIEELRGIVVAAGLSPSKSSVTQVLSGLRLLFGGGGTLGESGWQKLPGGLIVQWGKASTVSGSNGGQASGSSLVTFPTAFPTAVFALSVADESSGPGTTIAIGAEVVNLTTFKAHHATSAGGFFWFALGN